MSGTTSSPSLTVCNYDFVGPYSSISLVRNLPGVYLVCDLRSDGWYILDVGESENVHTRLSTHDRAPCWERNRRGTLGFAALYASNWSPDQRRILESNIRRKYNPCCGVR